MRVFFLSTVTLLLVMRGQTEPALKTDHDVAGSDYQALVDEWRNPDFLSREAAAHKLWERGDRALPFLERLSKSSDPEISQRALSVIRYIRAGLSPSTPRDIADLVGKYSTSGLGEKKRIVSTLETKSAYRQIFHLLKWDKNLNHKAQLIEEYADLGVKAAKSSILKNNASDAIELLEMAPSSSDNLRASAFLRSRHGMLAEKINEFKALTLLQKKARYKEFEYYVKATGDLNLLISCADSVGDLGAVAGAKLLQGDARDALIYLSENENNDESKRAIAAFEKFYTSAKLRELEPVARSLVNKTKTVESERVKQSLTRLQFLIGSKDSAEKFYLAEGLKGGFEYFDLAESPEICNQIIGLNKVKGKAVQFKFWVEHVVKQAVEAEDEDEVVDRVPIVSIITYLHSRGEVNNAKLLTSSYLNALKAEGLDRWFEVVADLSQGGLGEIIFPLILERGNNDNEFEQIVESLFQESDDVEYLWEFLTNLDRRAEDSFKKFCSLVGLRKIDEEELMNLEVELIEASRLKGAGKHESITKSLAVAAAYRNDLIRALKYYRVLAKIAQDQANGPKSLNREWLNVYVQLAFDLSEWEDVIVAHKLMQRGEGEVSTWRSSVMLGIAYRKNAKLRKGDKMIAQAVDASLMDPTEINEIANLLYIQNYKSEAIDIWVSSLLAYRPTDWEFHYSLQYLSSATGHYSKEGDWKLASALYGVENAMLMRSSSRKLNPALLLRMRFQFLFSRAMAEQLSRKVDSSKVIELLEEAHSMIPRDGLLADMFFPTVNELEFSTQYEKWFDVTFEGLSKVISKYPESHNSLNTAAWVGARAHRKLDESLAFAERAVKLSPKQGAYLDTMGEIYFARGERAKAIAWGIKAVQATGSGGYGFGSRYSSVVDSYRELNHQLHRFRHEKAPSE